MTRAIEQVHQACADEIANTCQAPKPTPLPEDPLEAFFGIRRGGGSSSSIRQMSARSSSDPFAAMRMSMESDPFFRLTMTPPSASASQLSPFGSSALLDELFGGDFGGIDRLMERKRRLGTLAASTAIAQAHVTLRMPPARSLWMGAPRSGPVALDLPTGSTHARRRTLGAGRTGHRRRAVLRWPASGSASTSAARTSSRS